CSPKCPSALRCAYVAVIRPPPWIGCGPLRVHGQVDSVPVQKYAARPGCGRVAARIRSELGSISGFPARETVDVWTKIHVRADQNPRTSRPKPAYERTKTSVRADEDLRTSVRSSGGPGRSWPAPPR